MKDSLPDDLVVCRDKSTQDMERCNGAFAIMGPKGNRLHVISSDGYGWEHVSVSVRGKPRTPTWEEMNFVKDLFWEEEECVFQFHPPRSMYVNCHPYCLHLWKPIGITIPVPSTILIGPKVVPLGS